MSATDKQNEIQGWANLGMGLGMMGLQLASAIWALVIQAQAAFGKSVPGPVKSQAVQTVVQGSLPGIDPAIVQPVIDSSVKAMTEANHPLFVGQVSNGKVTTK